MKIGILGAGYVGRILAERLVAAGHEVMLSNSRAPESLFSLRLTLGCLAGSSVEAAQFGEVVILAMPFTVFATIPAAVLADKIVIDAMNYYPERDGHIYALDQGLNSTSAMVQAHFQQARVVKTFNAIRMVDIAAVAAPAGTATRVAIPMAGDDAAAKSVVAGLVNAVGLDCVDVGDLAQGWRFENGTPAYCTLLTRAALLQALQAAQSLGTAHR
ncbi:NAD(P)-binding domain-containing protein [Vitreoscilla massiliensis]|uniref:NAD(P)-binding domain-containing protein n=1 Tax=Vitreoscilla massiliensis TaxID=1689272 RepID=A0ABY4E129_9NEIS|nr:NAD(P)-binding domain-containing protein [Vitreoscilla massiliensis]UOO89446.1 NAD(P)-binding domain-containing protein [Vitreoscilla massiliensis]